MPSEPEPPRPSSCRSRRAGCQRASQDRRPAAASLREEQAAVRRLRWARSLRSGAKRLVRAPPSRTGCSGAESSGPPSPIAGIDGRARPARGALGAAAGGLAGLQIERRRRLPFFARRRRIGRPVAVGHGLFERRTAAAGKSRDVGPLPGLLALRPFLGHARRRASSIVPSFRSRNDFSTSGFSGLGQPHPVGNGRQQVG